MRPRERVLAAVAHRQPDRVPLDYLAKKEAHRTLKAYLGIAEDEELLQRLGIDLRPVAPRPRVEVHPLRYADPTVEVTPDGLYKDIWGVGFVPREYPTGLYMQLASHPLERVTTIAELESYPWPTPDDWDYGNVRPDALRYGEYAVKAHSRGFFEISWFMRGMEAFLVDLATNPDLACALMDRIKDCLMGRIRRILEAAQGAIDIFELNDDVGTQGGLMMSPALWRRLIKPRMAEMAALCRSYGVKVMYHTCGGVRPIIPDLIEIGIDILDPVQPWAAGMEPSALKRDFGHRLTFHGSIDEQRTLPFGTADDVKREVEERIRVLGEDGGLILCPSHAIQADTPPENVLALYDTAMGHST